MERAFAGLGLLVVAAVTVVLAVANRAPVTLTVDPFGADPAYSLTLPLYAVIFAAVAAGVLLGGLVRALSRRKRVMRRDG